MNRLQLKMFLKIDEIVEIVLADAEIEAERIEDSEEELEESPPPLVTITEAYEALKKSLDLKSS